MAPGGRGPSPHPGPAGKGFPLGSIDIQHSLLSWPGLSLKSGLPDFNLSNAELGYSLVPLPSRFIEAPFRSGSPGQAR
ncbi:hypothetical protein CHELA40_11748 [Chelatococcus asaccharovorans]|nr:hypothetical protein CHELA40_11748 [Chelatococcus asaccharovorans]CAH1684145.1 hypothetical protein CHELA17_63853 [Chelatococcus asaccharovorans]